MEQLLHDYPVFSLEIADRVFGRPGGRATEKRIERALARGRVVRVLRTVYATVPPGANPETFPPDPFLVLHALRPDCVFCGHSALDLHGVSAQVWNRVSAYSRGRRAAYESGQNKYQLLGWPALLRPELLSIVDRSGTLLQVTSPELTIVEGFRYPKRAGGLEEFVRSADSFRRLNFDLLAEVLRLFDNRKLYSAVGWFLARNPGLGSPADFGAAIESRRPASPQYLDKSYGESVFDPRWNLMVPRYLLAEFER